MQSPGLHNGSRSWARPNLVSEKTQTPDQVRGDERHAPPAIPARAGTQRESDRRLRSRSALPASAGMSGNDPKSDDSDRNCATQNRTFIVGSLATRRQKQWARLRHCLDARLAAKYLFQRKTKNLAVMRLRYNLVEQLIDPCQNAWFLALVELVE